MRKYIFYLLAITFVLLLSACGGGESSKEDGTTATSDGQTKGNGTNGEPISKEVNFGEMLFLERQMSSANELEKYNLTFHNMEIQENVSEKFLADNEKYDYVKIDFTLENVGDIPINGTLSPLSSVSFSFFDENHLEVTRYPTDELYEGETRVHVEVRPDGKLEGYTYMVIPKGEQPVTMIYTHEAKRNIADDENDEYIFQLD